jgi:hypothetical protein
MIAEARSIVEDGFMDAVWDFGLEDVHTGEVANVRGVWLADRALGEEEGVVGDALVEVTLSVTPEELAPYQLAGMLWDASLWVPPADLLNKRGKARILSVDPRSSWWHEPVQE